MKVEKLKLKPALEGQVVRDPQTMKALSSKGELKIITTYWRRLLADGSVTIVAKSPKKEKLENDKY